MNQMMSDALTGAKYLFIYLSCSFVHLYCMFERRFSYFGVFLVYLMWCTKKNRTHVENKYKNMMQYLATAEHQTSLFHYLLDDPEWFMMWYLIGMSQVLYSLMTLAMSNIFDPADRKFLFFLIVYNVIIHKIISVNCELKKVFFDLTRLENDVKVRGQLYRGIIKAVLSMQKDAAPPKEETCAVCFEAFREPVRLTCGHYFCTQCIVKWFCAKGRCTCPLCRIEFL